MVPASPSCSASKQDRPPKYATSVSLSIPVLQLPSAEPVAAAAVALVVVVTVWPSSGRQNSWEARAVKRKLIVGGQKGGDEKRRNTFPTCSGSSVHTMHRRLHPLHLPFLMIYTAWY